MSKKRLRSGFTTGACAAAAAKAAAIYLLQGKQVNQVSIPFPDGIARSFKVKRCQLIQINNNQKAMASIIKDAGDDPDVTNGAEIIAWLEYDSNPTNLPVLPISDKVNIRFAAGDGVGMVTKPGLAITVGEPAINPIPREMIVNALQEPIGQWAPADHKQLKITIAVSNGAELAEKTLNHRLGIVGGLSILGTTGIVRPISADAWTATINASMDVAWETGCREIVLSTGRTSEKAVQNKLSVPIEAYAMMGDYLHFSLQAAKDHGFNKLHLAAMWAKILKGAMKIPQTHVRHGALDAQDAAAFIARLSGRPELEGALSDSNTAREIYDRLLDSGENEIIKKVCIAAKTYATEISSLEVEVYLVVSPGKVVVNV